MEKRIEQLEAYVQTLQEADKLTWGYLRSLTEMNKIINDKINELFKLMKLQTEINELKYKSSKVQEIKTPEHKKLKNP